MKFMLIQKTFRYRLEPNATQRQHFARYAGCCRFVFNHGLAERRAAYERDGQTLTYEQQCVQLTALKQREETSWLGEVHSQVLQQALKDLANAYLHFFRRVKTGEPPGFPRFKKKGRQDSFRYPQGVKVAAGRVYLPKIGWVRYRDSQPVEGYIRQTTIKREGPHWFVSLACELAVTPPPPAAIDPSRTVGLDVGLKSFAVLANASPAAAAGLQRAAIPIRLEGTTLTIDNPRFLQETLAKLRRAQRALSRKVKGSHNWRQRLWRVIKLHTRVKHCRQDFAHQVSTAIVKNHDIIAVEDLNIRGMVKNRRLSRAISDAGWAQFLAMLKYKAEWTGKHLVAIGRFVATSQTCSGCGARKPMPLSLRTYECGSCGTKVDRDWNASLNIRAAGLAVLNACGVGVSQDIALVGG
jgi:putative transposase